MAEGLGLNAAGKREQLKRRNLAESAASPGPGDRLCVLRTTVQLPGCAGDWRGGDDFASPHPSLETAAQQLGQSLHSPRLKKSPETYVSQFPGASCAMQASHRAKRDFLHTTGIRFSRGWLTWRKWSARMSTSEGLTLWGSASGFPYPPSCTLAFSHISFFVLFSSLLPQPSLCLLPPTFSQPPHFLLLPLALNFSPPSSSSALSCPLFYPLPILPPPFFSPSLTPFRNHCWTQWIAKVFKMFESVGDIFHQKPVFFSTREFACRETKKREGCFRRSIRSSPHPSAPSSSLVSPLPPASRDTLRVVIAETKNCFSVVCFSQF